MFFTQNDGTKTHFDVWDVGAERDMLLLHGNLASKRWWQPLLSNWPSAGKRGRAICAEWRGCGRSDAAKKVEDLHPKNLAKDFSALLDSVSHLPEKVDLVGHSTGGIIAAALALLRPEKVAHLVLIDSVGPLGVSFEPEFLKLFDTMKMDKNVCAQVLLSTVYGVDTATPFYSRLVDDAFGMAELNWRGVLTALTGLDLRKELAVISCPTLVLQGEHDQVCPREGAQLLASCIPNARYFELDGRGHCPIVEDPARVASIVAEFLTENR